MLQTYKRLTRVLLAALLSLPLVSYQAYAQSFVDCDDPTLITLDPIFDTSRYENSKEVDFLLQADVSNCAVTLTQVSIILTHENGVKTEHFGFDNALEVHTLDLDGFPEGVYYADIRFNFNVQNAGFPQYYNYERKTTRNLSIGDAPIVDPVPIEDTIRPTIILQGLPTTREFKDNMKGTYNVQISVSDNRSLQGVQVVAFDATWIDETNITPAGTKTFSRTFILDTSLYQDRYYQLRIFAVDSAGNTLTYSDYYQINNNFDSTPVDPIPASETEDPNVPANPNTPIENPVDPTPVIPNQDEMSQEEMLQTLIQLITQMMNLLSTLEGLTGETDNTRSIDINTMSNALVDIVSSNKALLKQNKKTKGAARLSKRINKTVNKAQRVKRARKKRRLTKKTNRLLERLLGKLT